MNALRFTCLAFLVCLFGALVWADIAAQEKPAEIVTGDQASTERPVEGQPPPKVAKPGPLYERIAAVVEAELAAAADLQARIAVATDDEELAALQRELETLKKETQVTILQLQADYAREQGRPEQAVEIEAAIENLRHPPRLPERTEESTGPDKSAGSGR